MKFRELLAEHNIPVAPENHHHAREGWIQLDCGMCSRGQQKWRLGYNVQYGYLSCWSCGYLPLHGTLADILDISLPKTRKLLDALEREYVKETREKRGRLVLPHGLRDYTDAHRHYLDKRGYDPDELARLWGVRAIANESELAWRLFLPIHYRGEVISWTTRSLMTGGARYINAKPEQEILSPKKILFGEDFVRSDSIIIVEGPFDVYKIGPGAVAVMGLSYTREQVLKIAQYKKRIVCFDNDKAAQARAKKLCRQIEVFPGETYRVQLDAKDAGESTRKEIRELRRML